jgi:hypothetical protein
MLASSLTLHAPSRSAVTRQYSPFAATPIETLDTDTLTGNVAHAERAAPPHLSHDPANSRPPTTPAAGPKC